MNQKTVLSLLRWMNRATGGEHINLEVLFRTAHYDKYATATYEVMARVGYDMEDFKKYSRIPEYLALFIKRKLYPKLRSPK